MTKKAIGLSEEGIEIAELKADGAAPAESDYMSLGKCHKDTATLEEAEGEVVTCECEELDDPEDEQYTKGKTTLKYSTSDLDPTSCHKTFGGTLTGEEDAKKWVAPSTLAPKTVAVRFKTKTGLKVGFTKMKLRSRINWAIKKNGYGLIEHTLTALSPISIDESTKPPAVEAQSAPLQTKSGVRTTTV